MPRCSFRFEAALTAAGVTLVLALGALPGAAASSPAGAGAGAGAVLPGSSISIAIAPDGQGFGGVLTAPSARCVPDRGVTLMRRQPGQRSFAEVGRSRTSSSGVWSIPTRPVPDAEYRVKASTKTLSASRTCRAETSPVVVARTSTVSLTTEDSTVRGTVGSPASGCSANRSVQVRYRDVYATKFKVRGTTTTDSGGGWTHGTAVPGQSYKATAGARQAGSVSCLPAQSTATLHRVVHVSTTGDDADPGTPQAPKRTIGAAVAAASAQAPHAVFVTTGQYDEGTLDLADGVMIYGGFSEDWRRGTSGQTLVAGEPVAVRAEEVTDAGMQLITLSADRGEGDTSSYGLFALDSTLSLDSVTVTAADGRDGASGAPPPASPTRASDGGQGQPGSEHSSGICSTSNQPLGGTGGSGDGVRQGGHGGAAGLGSGSGSAGSLGGGGAAGGAGAPSGQGNWNPSPLHWGAAGADGTGGSNGSAGSHVYSAGGFTPTDGSEGSSGGHGEGGGGGGGGGGGVLECDSYGGGGGGGGAGGLGGVGGKPGTSGGGSFGIYLWNSTLDLHGSTVTAGDGGTGGAGAAGQDGGPGGFGGVGTQSGAGNPYGGASEQDDGSNGGRGGHGGDGGAGGAGGGGAGGPSIGILVAGDSEVSEDLNSIVVGSGGPGGASPGNAGPDGVAHPVLVV